MTDYSRIDKAAFRLDGRAGTFTAAGGSPVPCLVLVRTPQEISGIGHAGLSEQNTQILVTTFAVAQGGVTYAGVADPRGGSFAGFTFARLAGKTWRVTSAELDEEGNTWTCSLNPTS